MEAHNKVQYSCNERLATERGYKVTNDGVLLNAKNKSIGSLDGYGYKRIALEFNGRKLVLFAHRLQAYQKYGEAIYSKGILVRHLDGDKTNNSIDNIAIGTNRDNIMDRPVEDRVRHANNATKKTIKYNRDEVVEFHNRNGKVSKVTMEHFGITSTGTLHYILNKRKFNDKSDTVTSKVSVSI